MSKKLKYAKQGTSQQLQQEYFQICTKLGQAIYAETEAQQQQAELREEQETVAEAFKAAVTREQDLLAAKTKADLQKKMSEDKASSNGAGTASVEAPATTPAT